MKMRLLKGDAGLNTAVLIVAGVTGTATGTALENYSLPAALGIAFVVGVVVGGALYVVIGAIKRRRSTQSS